LYLAIYQIMTNFNFSIPRHTQHLWEKISSRWSHYNHPEGQRFLGSVKITQTATDQVLAVVRDNLNNISRITYNSLYDKFDEPEQNWLKIITFALSEYAYYYSNVETKFWEGFCQRLNLSYTQGIENTLRQIAGEGFNLLGIVKAKGGYSYVSTLWLQSGIPQQNLQHFAQLTQEFSREYGWWEIAHNSGEDIAEELLNFCQEKHPQWKTLIHFLKASCSEIEGKEVEPIAGHLLQGIAIIAVELERKGTLPEELKDDNQRDKILGNYYLPNNFFLRNWDSLIKVLTHQRRQGSNRRIISRRPKPLSLILDVADSFNMQLVLPEQNLWKKGWENLGGTFCKIPQARWEDTIPTKPGLIIPEQVVNISNVTQIAQWELLDHHRQSLLEWKIEGVTNDLPCLIFDAWTGDRLQLNSDNLIITGTKEIIFFTAQGITLELGDGIEILDSCVPSSLKQWRGQHFTLTTQQSSIRFATTNVDKSPISWVNSIAEHPTLRGLQLKGKKSIYLEIPNLWYPPIEKPVSLHISIENLTQKQTIISTTENLVPSSNWQEIYLHKWITQPGKYEARLWNESNRWSYKFELTKEYQITGEVDRNNLIINSSSQGQLNQLPILTDSINKFWSEEISIKGLFPLEIINFYLQDKQETVFYQCQANAFGNLSLSVASLYDLLPPDADFYSLDYQRLGGEIEALMVMETVLLKISCNWDNQSVEISGLLPHENYRLSCWNLLLPENPPLKINIPLILSNDATITVPLELPPGIYHIQLFSSRKLLSHLGWWCGSNQHDLLDAALENEDLENYCYTILGNETSVENFIKASDKFDYDQSSLNTSIDSLKNSHFYFPEWLEIKTLIEKLQALSVNLKVDVSNPLSTEEVEIARVNHTDDLSGNQEKWLLIRLTNHKKRNLIVKQIEIMIAKHNLQSDNLIFYVPKERIYNDILLMKDTHINYINRNISLEYIQQITDLPLNDAQKILLN
jgi:hypothetical protein